MNAEKESEKKVVGIFGDDIPTAGQVYSEVVERLEEMLEEAKSGHLIGFVGVQVHAMARWKPRYVYGGHVPYRPVLGAIEVLKYDLLKAEAGEIDVRTETTTPPGA